ncbi:microtubule-binding protein [Bdellovibrio sp. HCB337]|uniref:microtubule-binding protein n=1 Tax=Bdellovibrio sp. HCB337 TaxID=3394358 RepID=UPI0039A5BE1D
MSFNYHKNKSGENQDSFWTSYSDLFLGLSTIFLLLYVISSLRTGTDAIRSQVDNQKLSMEVEELRGQLKMYENVKNEYMNNAPKDEMQEYQELMDKLTLLQEDAKTDKEKLIEQARENDKKEKALNKYQQMVRNVLNANKMAKSKIVNRDDLIKDQDVEIESKQAEIGELQKDIQQKKSMIAEGERKIDEANNYLKEKAAELKHALRTNKITKQRYEARMAQVRDENDKRVNQLAMANEKYNEQLAVKASELNQINAQLNQTQAQLGQTNAQLAQTQGALAAKEGEARGLYGQLQAQAADAQAKMAGLKEGFAAERARDKAAFDAELGRNKAMGAAERARREGEFKNAMAAKEKELGGKLAALGGQLRDTEGQLAKAKAEIEARKAVADEVKKGFAKAGIKADIDMETGDVVLDFGQAYFDSDSDHLKHEMKNVLEKAMPIYSRSLFGNPKLSDKISAVEIIGFASPTYKGRFIDPKSAKAEDKQAIKYNMDLSYRRANAIFGYVLDDNNMRFQHQKELVSLMKVSGRSFLEVMNVSNRNVANAVEFCKQNDCKKAQRVIIRFNVDQKK